MKGQVTAEYLLILLVSASLVGIAVFALTNLHEKSNQASQLSSFESDAHRLRTTIREACALGDGSVLTLLLFNEITIVDEGESTLLTGDSRSLRFTSPCRVEEGMVSGTVRLQNNDRTIEVFQD